MTRQSKAKIFLADERGCNETDWFRSYNTFNFGRYYKEHKQAFNNLYVLNDDTLSGGCRLDINVDENSLLLLLPVVGAVSFKDTSGNENTIHAGQLHISYSQTGDTIEISNPFKDELINFLQLRIKANTLKRGSKAEIFSFDLNENKNKLVRLSTAAPTQIPRILIGKFTGREETIYNLENKQSSLFVYIIEGVFEVQGRLLHSRDGLGLWNVSEEVELEALSNDAIVIMIELM